MTIFVDLTAAYDRIPRDFLFQVLTFRTSANFIILLLKKIYDHTTAYISGTKAKFDILIGCRQGGLESPTCFNYYFDFVLKVCGNEIDKHFPDGWGVLFEFRIPNECTNRQQRANGKVHGQELMKLILYADDLVLFCTSIEEAHNILKIINHTCKRFRLNISFKKTKTLVFGNEATAELKSLFSIEDTEIEIVKQFCYLGHTIYQARNQRLNKALGQAGRLHPILWGVDIF